MGADYSTGPDATTQTLTRSLEPASDGHKAIALLAKWVAAKFVSKRRF